MSEVIVALREVTKAYPGTLAAQNITVEFCRGEIHGVVGENGAGKSTLVKILAGLIQPDHGHIEVGNEICRFTNARASLLAGIGVVHQAGSLIESLTAEENLELGRLYSPHNSHQPGFKTPILPAGVPPNRRVDILSMRQRQLVEIHRLMLQQAQLLVLDEPTANLTRQESTLLFRDLEALAKAGHGVVVISHKLPELVSHCHRFTVLRKGRIVERVRQEDATVSKLVRLCSGSQCPDSTSAVSSSTPPPDDARVLVQLGGVTTASLEHEPLHGLDLVLRPGEILGIAGRTGSGASTLLKLLRNERVTLSRGAIEWDQATLKSYTDRAIGYVPADRVARGVILDLTLAENLNLRRRSFLGRLGGAAHRSEQRRFIDSLIASFDIRPANPTEKLRNLSGGNIQKVLLAREMDHSQMLLIVESPTAGLDIGSAAFVRTLLRQKANDGACVVIHSDDFDELVDLSDRVVILVDGRSTGELVGDEISCDSIGLALSEMPTVKADHTIARARTLKSEVICAD